MGMAEVSHFEVGAGRTLLHGSESAHCRIDIRALLHRTLTCPGYSWSNTCSALYVSQSHFLILERGLVDISDGNSFNVILFANKKREGINLEVRIEIPCAWRNTQH